MRTNSSSDAVRVASILSLALFAACASIDYTPPTAAEPPPLEIEIEAPFAEVWSRLESYIQSRGDELDVRRKERDLGQFEIAFGPVPPKTYADCGQITRSRPDYSGALTDFLAEHADGKLQGTAIIRAHRAEADRTPVTINIRYILTASTEDQDYSMSFNSSTPGRLRSGRSCRSTYELETNVIRALRGM
jgi:hypothetical protein